MFIVIITVISWHAKNNYVVGVDCYWLLDALLEYTTHVRVPPPVFERKTTMTALVKKLELPERMEGIPPCYLIRPCPYGRYATVLYTSLFGVSASSFYYTLSSVMFFFPL